MSEGRNDIVPLSNDIRRISADDVADVDRRTHILVHCSDDKYVELPKEESKFFPFIPQPENDEHIPEFEYPSATLEHLACWSFKYGMNGWPASELVRPCIYRDFSYVVTDEWDNHFFRQGLWAASDQRFYVTTMVAAEKFQMTGILDFMTVCFGCTLRREEDATITHDIMGVDRDTKISDDDLNEAANEYPWFKDLIKPTITK